MQAWKRGVAHSPSARQRLLTPCRAYLRADKRMYFLLLIHAPSLAHFKNALDGATIDDLRDAHAVLTAPGRHREREARLLLARIAELEAERAETEWERRTEGEADE